MVNTTMTIIFYCFGEIFNFLLALMEKQFSSLFFLNVSMNELSIYGKVDMIQSKFKIKIKRREFKMSKLFIGELMCFIEQNRII